MTNKYHVKHVKKGWGREVIFADSEQYAGKLLSFDKGGEMSMHCHGEKDECWYVLSGSFRVSTIDQETCEPVGMMLEQGDCWHNPPMFFHRLRALEAGSVIVEVSTRDSTEDNYRVMPGDSQKRT